MIMPSILDEVFAGESAQPKSVLDEVFSDSPPAPMTDQLSAAQQLRAPEQNTSELIRQADSIGPMGTMDAIRINPFVRSLLGPTDFEREAMIEKPVTPKALVDTAFKFMSPPPIVAEPIKAITNPAINLLPDAAAGITEGIRDAALEFPIAGAGLKFGEIASKIMLRTFEGDFALGLPGQYREFKQQLAAGNKRQAYYIATKAILTGAVLGYGERKMAQKNASQRAVAVPKEAAPVDAPSPTGVPTLDEVNAQLASKNAALPAPVEPPIVPVETLAQEAVRLGVDPVRWAKLSEDKRVFQRPQLAEQQASRAQRAAEKQQAAAQTAAEKAVWPKPNVAIPPPAPVAPTIPILFTPHVTPPPTKEPEKPVLASEPVKPQIPNRNPLSVDDLAKKKLLMQEGITASNSEALIRHETHPDNVVREMVNPFEGGGPDHARALEEGRISLRLAIEGIMEGKKKPVLAPLPVKPIEQPASVSPTSVDMRPNQPYPKQTPDQIAKQEASSRRLIEEKYRFASPEVQKEHGINPKTGLVEPTPAPVEAKPEVYRSISGDMHQVWVRLPGKSAVNIGSIEESPNLGNEVNAIKAAENHWKVESLIDGGKTRWEAWKIVNRASSNPTIQTGIDPELTTEIPDVSLKSGSGSSVLGKPERISSPGEVPSANAGTMVQPHSATPILPSESSWMNPAIGRYQSLGRKDMQVLVTQDAAEPEMIRATYLIKGEPTGHQLFRNLSDLKQATSNSVKVPNDWKGSVAELPLEDAITIGKSYGQTEAEVRANHAHFTTKPAVAPEPTATKPVAEAPAKTEEVKPVRNKPKIGQSIIDANGKIVDVEKDVYKALAKAQSIGGTVGKYGAHFVEKQVEFKPIPISEPTAKPTSFADHREQWDKMKNPPTKKEALATIDANDNRIAQLQRDLTSAKGPAKQARLQKEIETLADESDALAEQHALNFKAPPTEAPPAAPVEAPTIKSATEEMAALPKAPGKVSPMADLTKDVGMGIPNPVTVAKAAVQLTKQAGAVVAPKVRTALEYVNDVRKEQFKIAHVTPQRRAFFKWSGDLQRSFSEAANAKADITELVPDRMKRAGINRWIDAGGDMNKLMQWDAATKDPRIKAEYRAAMNLTAKEVQTAEWINGIYKAMADRGGQQDVLRAHKDNYVTHMWDMGKGPAAGVGRTLKQNFRYAKARTLPDYFTGEQLGYRQVSTDIADIVPTYIHEMNATIAARKLVQDLSTGTATDGRPLVSLRGEGSPTSKTQYVVIDPKTSIISGVFDSQVAADAAVKAGEVVQPREITTTFVKPDTANFDTSDYRVMEKQPALKDWKWVDIDPDGNKILMKGDLALHPDAYKQMNAALGKSAIKDWYQKRTTASAEIPKTIVHGLDAFQQETKRTMLGLFAPFHQVQEGWHAVGHRVNPLAVTQGGIIDRVTKGKLNENFVIPKIDLVNDVKQADAANHGLMLESDRAGANQFMEGFRVSGVLNAIPGVKQTVGKLAMKYQEYLFGQYIPGLKFKTWTAMVERNTHVYAKDLAAGTVTPEDIKALSAEQSNAAYGHLNYVDLGRNPTVQHFLQLGLLAPDFLEARGRFTLQGAKGAIGVQGVSAKVGREQFQAIFFLAALQAAGAYIGAKLTGGQWDKNDPFAFHTDNRKYTLRSVPEDFVRAWQDLRPFIYGRLNPVVGKGVAQLLTGIDYRSQKITTGETLKELGTAWVPLAARSLTLPDKVRELPGMEYLLPKKKVQPVSPLDQLAGTLGLKVSRYYPESNIRKLHYEWMANNPDPQIKESYERAQSGNLPSSRYKVLDMALDDRKESEVKTAIQELIADKVDPKLIRQRMNPFSAGKTKFMPSTVKPLFHERMSIEKDFVESLTPEQKKVYDAAVADRRAKWEFFKNIFDQR